jgi:hypothetical protein
MGDGRKGGKEEERRREVGAVLSRATRGFLPARPSSATNTGRPSSRNLNMVHLSHRLDSHTRHRMTRF